MTFLRLTIIIPSFVYLRIGRLVNSLLRSYFANDQFMFDDPPQNQSRCFIKFLEGFVYSRPHITYHIIAYGGSYRLIQGHTEFAINQN